MVKPSGRVNASCFCSCLIDANSWATVAASPAFCAATKRAWACANVSWGFPIVIESFSGTFAALAAVGAAATADCVCVEPVFVAVFGTEEAVVEAVVALATFDATTAGAVVLVAGVAADTVAARTLAFSASNLAA